MLVKDYMTRHPFLAEPSMSIVEAQRLMGENNIRHLPVVGEGKRLLGLVTRNSLLVEPSRLSSLDMWEIARYLSGLTVRDVMIKARDVITIHPDATIEDAARIMVECKVGCLPVAEGEFVVGILTDVDMMAHLMQMMAATTPAVRVTVRMPDVRGELAKLVGAIAGQGWGILALGGAPAPREPGKWDAVVKIRYVTKEQVAAALSQVEGQQIVDIRET
ncbi:MAG: CBS domain-containing protein [Anaerolineae bacterium]|nr:CBS domain-containing protein [Anaerolineae bacterium]